MLITTRFLKLIFFSGLVATIFFACKKEDNSNILGGPIPLTDTISIDTTAIPFSTLKVTINTFSSTNGKLLAALFNSSANYTNGVQFQTYIASISGDSLRFEFDSIPPGTYCLSCFHDANSNNMLDKNFFGAPTEGYGFSNNPGITFGAPPFSQLQFVVNSTDTLQLNVNLIYL
jgi:uncharacterized protein (DUF2141 family)